MARSILGSHRFKARGVASNRAGRFDAHSVERVVDGWYEDEPPPRLEETVLPDRARSLITTNDSPDVGFEASINPYRGCSHGCIYCFARPSHAYLGLSPGLDFETKLFYKSNAVDLLEAELARPGYRPKPIALGINTDAYQPLEQRLGVTRGLLGVLARYRHPVSLITKSASILRDRDLLQDLARDQLVSVMFSVTSLSDAIKRSLEPRTASPQARLRAMRELADDGIPVGVMVAPVIPAITDMEIEDILAAAREAGASCAGYVLLRLPYEVKELFREWLAEFYPDRAKHVMSLLQQSHGGKDYDSRFGQRMRGAGPFADLLHTRFRLAARKLGLASGDARHRLNTAAFQAPVRTGGDGQLSLGF